MKLFTVTFFGHRRIENHKLVSELLDKVITDIMNKHKYVEFLIGRNGDFDILAASSVRRCRRILQHDDCTLTLVLPYPNSDYEKNQDSYAEYYDSIEMCQKAYESHFKYSICVRNRIMADRSDLIICFISDKTGGAYKSVRYAESIKTPIINLA